MDMLLNAVEARVLGSLMEKELATPEYYPLSLNALVNACNQKTNRMPVMMLEAKAVALAVQTLKEKQAVLQSDTSRVPKYWQSFGKKNNLINRETALLSVLLLRGPQTAGELRSRSENLAPFADIEGVLKSLENLTTAGLVCQLPRQPGQKEQRFAQLLTGEPELTEQAVARQEPVMLEVAADQSRIAELEEAVAELQAQVEQLQDQFLRFKEQFE